MFYDDNIVIGGFHEWLWLLDAILVEAFEAGVSRVSIFTGVVVHNINESVYFLYDGGAHELEDSYRATLSKLSVFAVSLDGFADAILGFQKLRIVRGVVESRSCMSPIFAEFCPCCW